MANTSEQELISTLTKMIDQLIQEGLIKNQSPAEKKALSQVICDALLKSSPDISLPTAELSQSDTQKALRAACLAASNPNNRFDYTALFKTTYSLEEKDRLKEQLTHLFNQQLEENFKKNPQLRPTNRREQDELEEKTDALADKLADNLLNQQKKEPASIIDFIFNLLRLDPIAQQKANLYGNQDEKIAKTVSDDAGVENFSSGEGNSFEANKKQIKGDADPLSLLAEKITDALAEGLEEIDNLLNDLSNTYHSPKPKGPGQING